MNDNLVRRFSRLEIAYHWARAIPYLVSFLTGAAILLQRLLAVELVPYKPLSLVHRVSGIVLIVVLAQVLIASIFSGGILDLLRTMRDALSWRVRDFVWLVKVPFTLVWPRVSLPPVGRFNAGQKLHLLFVPALVLGFVVTGLIMMFAPPILGAWIIHALLFVPACIFLGVHLFLSLINPPTRRALTGVFTGFVCIEYAQAHHPLWVNDVPKEAHGRIVSWPALLATLVGLCLLLGGAVWSYGPRRLTHRTIAVAQRYGSDAILPGALCASHAKDPKGRWCTSCHEMFAPPSSAKCVACHGKIQVVESKRIGYHGTLTSACRSCHREHRGESADIRHLNQVSFNHNRARFPLDGKHRELECVKCHVQKDSENPQGVTRYIGLSFSGCSDCHPNPHLNPKAFECARCHTTPGWKRPFLLFDHNRDCDYHLEGKHGDLDCGKCHKAVLTAQGGKTLNFYGLGSECNECHKDPHQGKLGEGCIRCHTERGWTGRWLLFNHTRDSRFTLNGAHAAAECRKCHMPEEGRPLATAAFKGMELACNACHEDPHGRQFEKTCDQCHSDFDWKDRWLVDSHGKGTKYPLLGKHRFLTCVQCHPLPGPDPKLAQARFAATPTTCGDCHKDPHRGQMQSPCSACHTEQGWRGAALIFTHKTASAASTEPPQGFVLDATHTGLPCASCHKGGKEPVYRPLPKTCEGCHEDVQKAIKGVTEKGKEKPDPHASRVACVKCHLPDVRHQSSDQYAATCRSCHNERYDGLFFDWMKSLQERQAQAEAMLQALQRTKASDATALAPFQLVGALPIPRTILLPNVAGDRPAGPAGLNAGHAGLPIASNTLVSGRDGTALAARIQQARLIGIHNPQLARKLWSDILGAASPPPSTPTPSPSPALAPPAVPPSAPPAPAPKPGTRNPKPETAVPVPAP